MFSIIYQWLTFRIYLPGFEAWLRANAGDLYVGNSADDQFTLWFTSDPGLDIAAAIDAQWNSLTSEGEDAKWTLVAQQQAALAQAKIALLTMDLTTSTVQDRKILMNMPLTSEDLAALLIEYPQT